MKPRSIAAIAAVTFAVVGCSDSTSPKARSCDRGLLNDGASASGTLASGACSTGGQYAQTYVDYRVTVLSGQRYLFTVQSDAAWKPLLFLIDPADPAAGSFPGWSDDLTGMGAHSELLFVSPYNGTVTLRVAASSGTPGAFTLRSSQCGGSSAEIFTAGTVSTQSTISASDCVVHDRFLDADSTHAESYVLYLGRNETKTVTVAARGTSADTFHPALIVTGPFLSGLSTSHQRSAWSSPASTLSVQVTGGSQAGDYMLVVGGAGATTFGDYTLTIGPPSP